MGGERDQQQDDVETTEIAQPMSIMIMSAVPGQRAAERVRLEIDGLVPRASMPASASMSTCRRA
jgi:hypothetical protein